MSAPKLRKHNGKFFLDTRSDASLIKFKALDEDLIKRPDKKIKVSGIAEKEISSIGTVLAHFTDKSTRFNVTYDLPIEADALIGKPYFREEKAEISFNHNTLVTQSDPFKPKPFIDSNPYLSNKPFSIKSTTVFRIRARSRQLIPIEVTNKDLQGGYLPRVATQKGV